MSTPIAEVRRESGMYFSSTRQEGMIRDLR